MGCLLGLPGSFDGRFFRGCEEVFDGVFNELAIEVVLAAGWGVHLLSILICRGLPSTVMIVAHLFICRYVSGGRGSVLRGCACFIPCFY